jgi:hypothetical protein
LAEKRQGVARTEGKALFDSCKPTARQSPAAHQAAKPQLFGQQVVAPQLFGH